MNIIAEILAERDQDDRIHGVVYLARNLINGKCYIGITSKSLQERKSDLLLYEGSFGKLGVNW